MAALRKTASGMRLSSSEYDLQRMRVSALERYYKRSELVDKLGMLDEDADAFRKLLQRYTMWRAVEWNKVSPPPAEGWR